MTDRERCIEKSWRPIIAKLARRNAGLDADVHDLKEGLVAVEERARAELGMIKPNETYYHVKADEVNLVIDEMIEGVFKTAGQELL